MKSLNAATIHATASTTRLVSAKVSERVAAPDDLWDLNQHSTWNSVVWELISDFADARLQKAFLRSKPEYLVSDDLSWLDDLVLKLQGYEIDSKQVLADRLHRRFRAIRTCHGTSTHSLDEIYKQGLRPLAPEEFHAQARQIFLSGEFAELSEANLLSAIEAVGCKTREGHIYFEANERFLIEMCGHYMLYGSEYLTALAANLGGNRDYRRVLKGRHPPTLLICDVPLELIPPRTVTEFAGIALQSIFQELIDGPAYDPIKWHGLAFSIQEQLEPSCIVGHYHPSIPRDPFG